MDFSSLNLDTCPRIEDLRKWARSNGYVCQSAGIDSRPDDKVVFRHGRVIGLARRYNGAWAFKPYNIPEDSLSSSSSSEEEDLPNTLSTSALTFGYNPIEMTGQTNDSNLRLDAGISGTGVVEQISECNYFLPFAAEHYHISPNIRDYILVPIPAMFSYLPNTNGDSLTTEELTSFKPDIGRLMYKTFQGMPTCYEHSNKDLTKARGIIFDAFLRKVVGFGAGRVYKLVLLLGFDRTKDAQLTNDILTRKSNAYSVGFGYTAYKCAVCGHEVSQRAFNRPCVHTRFKQPTYRDDMGRLNYRHCLNAKGVECSSVEKPAFAVATGPSVLDVSLTV